MRWVALFSCIAMAAACTWDGLDGYDHADGSLPESGTNDAAVDVAAPDVAIPETSAKDVVNTVDAEAGCDACLPIHCANVTCIAPAEICCGTLSVPDGGIFGATITGYACVPTAQCVSPNMTIHCSGPESCSGTQVCCGTNGPYNGANQCVSSPLVASTDCKATCNIPSFDVGCDASSDCHTNGTCITSVCSLPSYTICTK